MYFGDYLLKEKLITEDQLIEAVSLQHESIPSFIKIIQKNNLIKPSDIVELIFKSHNTKRDLINIIKDEKILDDKDLELAKKVQAEQTKSLGECLVELSILDLKSLENHLSNYIVLKNEYSEENLDTASENDSLEETETTDESDSIGNIDLEEFVSSEEKKGEVVESFLKTFDDKLFAKLNKLSGLLKDAIEGDGDITNLFSTLYRDICILKTAFTLVESKSSEKIVECWETLLENMFNMNNEQLKEWFGSNIELLNDSINILWEIRSNISNESSEQSLWLNEDWKEKFSNNYKAINNIPKNNA
ncbi:MAG: hypothetical protein ACO20H_11390 [Bacteriovoracaceae bacterium]